MSTKQKTFEFSAPFELGFRAGYWGRDVNPYKTVTERRAFEFGEEMGRYAATMPGKKGREHFTIARFFILGLIHAYMGNNTKAKLN